MLRYVPLVDFTECSLDIKNDSDVSQDAIAKAGNKLFEAFSTSGFAYLSNHGIPSEAMEGFQNVMEHFFRLPEANKMRYCTKNRHICYDPIGGLRVSPKREHDYQEAFRVTGNAMGDEDAKWPEEPPEFKDKCLHFAECCKQLILRLMKALGVGMKLKDPLYLQNCHKLLNQKGNSTMLKAIRYPPLLSDDTLKENQLRIGEHTDWICLTLLFQDQNGGLQVANSEGKFEDVPPIPGTIVLNIGDCLQFWSSGRLKSSVHRVVPPPDPDKRKNVRRSFVYFGSADDHVTLGEMEFQPDAIQPRWGEEFAEIGSEERKSFTVVDYVEKRFKDMFY